MLVDDAHRAGLLVHPWTFRRENAFLPEDLRRGDPADPAYLRGVGDLPAELRQFRQLGVDGLFSDNPDLAVAIRDELFGTRGAPSARVGRSREQGWEADGMRQLHALLGEARGSNQLQELARWLNPVAASPAAPRETVAAVDAFGPSLMPRTARLHGVAMGLGMLGARATTGAWSRS